MAHLGFSQRQRRAPAAASASSPAQPVQRVAAPASLPITLPYSLAQTPISEPERPSRSGKATGLPPALKAGIEKLSRISLDGVSVHYHSGRPARLGAAAYTQGEEIHLAPGQQRHLPHEAWHVVQQKQGRVRPTLRLPGLPLNDRPDLEREASIMGARAATAAPSSLPSHAIHTAPTHVQSGAAPVQMNNESLTALANYLGVSATIGAVAYALGITTTALTTGLAGLGTAALGWSAYKLVGYLTGKPEQEVRSEGSGASGEASGMQRSSRSLQQEDAPKKKQKKSPPKATEPGERSQGKQKGKEPELEESDEADLLRLYALQNAGKPQKKAEPQIPRRLPAPVAQQPRQRVVAPGMKDRAKAALNNYKPRKKLSTICVFLDSAGNVISYGESGWEREGRGQEISRHLSNISVAHKSQATGYGGIQCAEPEAILDAHRSRQMHRVAYSLAYDQKSKGYKAACPSCQHYFKQDRSEGDEIVDLHLH
jgi:hypothetical protein